MIRLLHALIFLLTDQTVTSSASTSLSMSSVPLVSPTVSSAGSPNMSSAMLLTDHELSTVSYTMITTVSTTAAVLSTILPDASATGDGKFS